MDTDKEYSWSKQQERIRRWFMKDQDFFKTLYQYGDLEFYIDVNGNLVIRARAGTGKTTIIIEGVKLAPERNILVCAFSKIIQVELEKRIGSAQMGKKAQTLHSVGLGCVRKFRSNIKVDFSSARAESLTRKVCGTAVPDAVMRLVTTLHTKGREIAPHANEVGDLIDIAITFDCEPEESWVKSGYGLDFVEARALEAMELASKVNNGDTIDGSDMIFLPVRNHWLTPQYDMVVVDEAQDMTTAQLEIGRGVLKPGGRMCIVGDDRQAIFGFRGADSDSIDRLKTELNAGELGLTTTYRCGKVIVDTAKFLVPDFEAGPNNPEGEIQYLKNSELFDAVGPGDFVLSRLNAPLVTTAMKLLRAGKRTQIAGRDIGKSLTTLVNRFRAASVPDFIRKVEAWSTKKQDRLKVQMAATSEESRKKTIQAKIDDINDTADMLIFFTEDATNIYEVTNRIVALFEDDGLGAAGKITCSSIHRAKGLEADRVFVMADTLRNWSIEEKNLQYVAITRAKNTLVWLSDKGAE